MLLGFSAEVGVTFTVSPALQNSVVLYDELCRARDFGTADPIRKVLETFGMKVSRDKSGKVTVHATAPFDENELDAKLEALK
jgi:hypothetical protein